jgi:hypothetical protein
MTTKYPASQSLSHLQHSNVFNAKLHYDYPVILLSSVMSISTFCLSYSIVAVLSQPLLGRSVLSLLQYFKCSTQSHRSRDSAVGIVTGYGLDDKGVGVQVLVGSGAHPASYPKGTGGSFPGGKELGHEADHSPPASAQFKKTWIYTFTPPYVMV